MREQIDQLIIYLMAIQGFSKDIHYTCHGEAFYSKHLLVDKFNFDEDIDVLKECCLLGSGEKPLPTAEYMKETVKILAVPKIDDRINFEYLIGLIQRTLSNVIDEFTSPSKADENIIGTIAQKLKQYKGLLDLQLTE